VAALLCAAAEANCGPRRAFSGSARTPIDDSHAASASTSRRDVQ